jgi:hypothetical protein
MGRVPSALGSDTGAPCKISGKVMSVRWGTAVRGFREAGAGGSNPLTPTSFSAIFHADVGLGYVPEMTERDANTRHRLAPGWHRCSGGVLPAVASSPPLRRLRLRLRHRETRRFGGCGQVGWVGRHQPVSPPFSGCATVALSSCRRAVSKFAAGRAIRSRPMSECASFQHFRTV